MEPITFTSEIDKEEVEFIIKPESLEAQRRCDNEYSLAYVQAIRMGIPPRSVLEKMLRDSGMWTQDDDTRLEQIKIGIVKLEMELAEAKTDKEGLPIARQLAELRTELVQITQQHGEILNNSADFMAEQVRRDAFIAYSTYYKDTGKKVFKDYSEFVNRSDEQLVQDARRAIALQMFNEFGMFMDALPEAKYREVSEDAITEANAQVAATRKKVNKKKSNKKTAKKVAAKE